MKLDDETIRKLRDMADEERIARWPWEAFYQREITCLTVPELLSKDEQYARIARYKRDKKREKRDKRAK